MNNLYVGKSPIHGRGLLSRKSYRKGDLIGTIKGEKVIVRGNFPNKLKRKSMDWIGVGRYTWIDTTNSPFKYINHSCNPNSAVVTKLTVRALKDIAIGEEITMDYSLTEADPEWSILCTCGEKNCRKKIGPIYSLSKSDFNSKKNIISDNFKSVFKVGKIF
jgi:SET domain-containing protein